MCEEKKCCCSKPEELQGKPEECKPEDCSPEQIKKCHGDVDEHTCDTTDADE